jgi:hypothetical protein
MLWFCLQRRAASGETSLSRKANPGEPLLPPQKSWLLLALQSAPLRSCGLASCPERFPRRAALRQTKWHTKSQSELIDLTGFICKFRLRIRVDSPTVCSL